MAGFFDAGKSRRLLKINLGVRTRYIVITIRKHRERFAGNTAASRPKKTRSAKGQVALLGAKVKRAEAGIDQYAVSIKPLYLVQHFQRRAA